MNEFYLEFWLIMRDW